MSRNGVACTTPSSTSRTCPAFSVTKTRDGVARRRRRVGRRAKLRARPARARRWAGAASTRASSSASAGGDGASAAHPHAAREAPDVARRVDAPGRAPRRAASGAGAAPPAPRACPRAVSRSAHDAPLPATRASASRSRKLATPRIRALTVARHASSARSATSAAAAAGRCGRPCTARRERRRRGCRAPARARSAAAGRRRTARARRRRAGTPARRARRRGCARTRPRRTSSGCRTDSPIAASLAGFARSTDRRARVAEVAVQVAPDERRQPGVAHDVAAGDRAVPIACGSSSTGSGRRRRSRIAVPAGVQALEARPAVVGRRARRRSPRTRPGRRRRSRAARPRGRTRSATGCAGPAPSPPARARPGSSRISLPSSEAGSCECPNWLFDPPPSPVPSHSLPSGPNCSCPPLWFSASVCGMLSSSRPLRRIGDVGSPAERRYSQTWISPEPAP